MTQLDRVVLPVPSQKLFSAPTSAFDSQNAAQETEEEQNIKEKKDARQKSETSEKKEEKDEKTETVKDKRRFFQISVKAMLTGDPHDHLGILRQGDAFTILPLVPQTPPLSRGGMFSVNVTSKPIKLWKGDLVVIGGVEFKQAKDIGRNTNLLAFYNNPEKGLELGFLDQRYAGGNYLTQLGAKFDLSTIASAPKGTKFLFSVRDSKFFPDELRTQLIKENFLDNATDITGGVVFVGEDSRPALVLGVNRRIGKDSGVKAEFLANRFHGRTVVLSANTKIGDLKINGYLRSEEHGYDVYSKEPGLYGAINAVAPIGKGVEAVFKAGYERGFRNREAFAGGGLRFNF